MDTLDIKIAKARENLLPESRNAIDAVNWKLIIQEMNNKFDSNQIENLIIETELLLCGLVSTENFPKELETRMLLSKNDVSLLLAEMDKLIFKKMHEGFEKRLNQKKEVEVVYKSKSLTNDPNLVNTPKDVQTAVSLSNWKEKLYNISKEFSLSVEKMGELEDITVKTLKGELLASKYENEVLNRIAVPEDRGKEMVAKINEEIFKVIKGTLVNSSNIKENINIEIPIPPYNPKITEGVPLPPSSYKKQEEEKEVKKINNIVNEDDLYKEHGIEIISDVPVSQESEIFTPIMKENSYREEIPTKIKKGTEVTISSVVPNSTQEKVEYREEIPNILKKNIITDKLSKNMIGETKMSDYTLPKISTTKQAGVEKFEGEKPANPHDPYHEAI